MATMHVTYMWYFWSSSYNYFSRYFLFSGLTLGNVWFFKKYFNAIIMFKTKYQVVQTLVDLEHGGKASVHKPKDTPPFKTRILKKYILCHLITWISLSFLEKSHKYLHDILKLYINSLWFYNLYSVSVGWVEGEPAAGADFGVYF